MGLSFFNAERQRKQALENSLSFTTSDEEPTSPSFGGVEVEPKKIEVVEEKEYVKPKKKRTK